jgi:hypothetical protein
MSLSKNRPKHCPIHFFVKIKIIWKRVAQKLIWDISLFFQKLAKLNNHPIGEKSPNLVTLIRYEVMLKKSA